MRLFDLKSTPDTSGVSGTAVAGASTVAEISTSPTSRSDRRTLMIAPPSTAASADRAWSITHTSGSPW
jgi:hypothetical protein